MKERYRVSPTFNNIYWVEDWQTPMRKSICYFKDKDQAEGLCRYLNQMDNCVEHFSKENERIRQTIRIAVSTERTVLGKSVLKQLAEQVGVELEK